MLDREVTSPAPIKLIIADADPLSRTALADMVRRRVHVTVAAQAANPIETIELVNHYRPTVLLADEALLAADDYALVRDLAARLPELAVVMLTKGEDAATPLDALRAGVVGILSKESEPDALAHALDAVSNGRAIIEPTVTMALIQKLRQSPTVGSGFRPIHSSLTNREWEILDLLVEGAATKEIANRLYLTQDTVYSHVKNILRKMNVNSRAEAVEAVGQLYELRAAA